MQHRKEPPLAVWALVRPRVYLYSIRMATAESIRLSDAEPLLETETEIADELIDKTGYAPVGFGPKGSN